MRSRTKDTISSRRVHEEAEWLLREHVQIQDHGHRCRASVLISVLFFAASRVTSVFDACQRLLRAPSDDAVRKALVATLPQMAELERRLNAALRGRLPKGLWKKRRPAAIDIHEIPYHGQPYADPRELRRGKRKSGTTWFHGYATLCVVHHGERFTLALTPVWSDDSHKQIVQRLLTEARKAGFQPRFLLLDRGFYGLDVVTYLQSARCPFLMPVVHRGRRPKDLSRVQGTRRFLTWKRSGFSEHTLRNKSRTRRVQIAVAVKRFTHRGKKRRKVLVYAFWGFRPASPVWVSEAYRRRFGIETSYRQTNQARIRTSTRNPLLRLLFVGIALILRNVWVWIHRMHLAIRRGRDGLQLRLHKLRLRTMLLYLQRYAEAWLGCTEPITTELISS